MYTAGSVKILTNVNNSLEVCKSSRLGCSSQKRALAFGPVKSRDVFGGDQRSLRSQNVKLRKSFKLLVNISQDSDDGGYFCY